MSSTGDPFLEDDLSPAQAEALILEARAELHAGRVVPHARVVEWAARRADGEHVALPVASEAEMADGRMRRS